MSAYKTPSHYIDTYPLLDMISNSGYVLDKKSSSSKWLVFKNETKTDTILYNTKSKIYKNTQIDNDKGNVLNFMANRVNGIVLPDSSKEAFFKAYQTLDQNSKTLADKELQSSIKKIVEKKKLLSHSHHQEFNCKPIHDYKFLTETRCISTETIDDPLFKGKIFNSYFILKNDHVITNYAFGKFKDDKLVGLEIRNANLNIIEGKHDALFNSNFDKSKTIDLVFIAESAIDVLSYYELYKDNSELKDKNLLFISTGGNMYDSILEELKELLNSSKTDISQTKIVSITDNDKAGLHYDQKLLATLITNYSDTEVNLMNKDDFFYNYTISELNTSRLSKLQELVTNFNNTVKDNAFGNYIITKSADNNITELKIPLKLGIGSEFMASFKNLLCKDLKYYTHKPKSLNSDWNDVLVSKKKSNQRK